MILAIDPGASCGWCVRDGEHIHGSGTWDLGVQRNEGGGMRYLRLRTFMLEIHEATPLKLIAYEEVRNHTSRNLATKKITFNVDAAHAYGGYQGEILKFSEEYGVPATAFPVGTIKKKATGKGNANKEKMLAAAQERWPQLNVDSFDQADALWISECAHQKHGKAL